MAKCLLITTYGDSKLVLPMRGTWFFPCITNDTSGHTFIWSCYRRERGHALRIHSKFTTVVTRYNIEIERNVCQPHDRIVCICNLHSHSRHFTKWLVYACWGAHWSHEGNFSIFSRLDLTFIVTSCLHTVHALLVNSFMSTGCNLSYCNPQVILYAVEGFALSMFYYPLPWYYTYSSNNYSSLSVQMNVSDMFK